MSSCVPFIKCLSPLWQSPAQTDSLGFDKELKQVHTRRGSSTAAICLGEQRPRKIQCTHLHTTYCTNLYSLTCLFIWVRYHTWTWSVLLYKLPVFCCFFDWTAIVCPIKPAWFSLAQDSISGLNITLHPHRKLETARNTWYPYLLAAWD